MQPRRLTLQRASRRLPGLPFIESSAEESGSERPHSLDWYRVRAGRDESKTIRQFYNIRFVNPDAAVRLARIPRFAGVARRPSAAARGPVDRARGIRWISFPCGATMILSDRGRTDSAATPVLPAFLITSFTAQIGAALVNTRCLMTRLAFEERLNYDLQTLCRHSFSPVEIHVTRWGELADDWVSWDVDMMVPPERMDANALKLYGQLGVLLNQEPYRIMEEGIAADRIGYMVTSEAAVG
jgi:hypothetical protein